MIVVVDLLSGLVWGQIIDEYGIWRFEHVMKDLLRAYGLPKVILWYGLKGEQNKRIHGICEELRIQELYEIPEDCTNQINIMLLEISKMLEKMLSAGCYSREEWNTELTHRIWELNHTKRGIRRRESPVMKRKREWQAITYMDFQALEEIFFYRTKRMVKEDGCVYIVGFAYMAIEVLGSEWIGEVVEIGVNLNNLSQIVVYEPGTYRQNGVCYRVE